MNTKTDWVSMTFLAQDTSEWNKKKLSPYNVENSKATLVIFWILTKNCQTCVKLQFIFLFIKLSRLFSLWEAQPTNNQTQLTCYWLDKQITSHLYCYTLCEFIFCSGTNLHRFWADNCFPLCLFCWLSNHDSVWRWSVGFIDKHSNI